MEQEEKREEEKKVLDKLYKELQEEQMRLHPELYNKSGDN